MQIQCWGHWKITGLLYLYWPIRLGCYAMGLPISDSVWNCGRSLVLWVPGTSGSIGNGILGEYFPEREYNLLDPKRTRKRPKFQPCLKYLSDLIKSLIMMMNNAKDDIPVQFCISKPLLGQLRSHDGVIRSIYVSFYNIWLECERDMGLVHPCVWTPPCLSRWG